MPQETVILKMEFRDSTGNPADLDSFPQISIQEPSGNAIVPFTSLGVYHVETGIYAYDYSTGVNPSYGVWTDNWRGNLGSVVKYETRNFIVNFTQQQALNIDGYHSLGDDVPYDYSQNAICNINKLLKLLRSRLNSRGKSRVKDAFGNEELVDCDIFTVEALIAFLITGIEEFNAIPFYTQFTFEDTEFLKIWGSLIVQRALYEALASKQLIERGREFDLSDNGMSFKPPGVSEVLGSQYAAEMSNWLDKVKIIKSSMRPYPLAIASIAGDQGAGAYGNLQVARQRLLRARRLF